MTICERCMRESRVTTGSYFNTEVICIGCAEAERQHPDFERAHEAEVAAVRRGDYNYPGVGLPADLRAGP